MPYVDQEARNQLNVGAVPRKAGELNYVITKACLRYLRNLEGPGRKLGYQDFNDVIGALECAKMELNRVIIGPYEDIKIAENGPVYDGILPSGEY